MIEPCCYKGVGVSDTISRAERRETDVIGRHERRGLLRWYLYALKRYDVFSGRARRKEYWSFALVNCLIAFALAMATRIAPSFGVAYILYGLVMIIPSLAVSIRRLHDTNRSGWWLLLAFVPLIGSLILLVVFVQRGNHGQNRYGADPIQEPQRTSPGT